MTGSVSQLSGLSSGGAAKFLVFQTVCLVVFAVWAFGGRAEGALEVIGWLGWSSLLVILFDIQRVARWRWVLRRFWGTPMWLCYGVVFFVLFFGVWNARGEIIELSDGFTRYEPRVFWEGLPSAFVRGRSFDYSLLFSGLWVQCSMLWIYCERGSRVRLLFSLLASNALVLTVVGAYFRLYGNGKLLGIEEALHSGFYGSFRYHNHWIGFALLALGQCIGLAVYFFERAKMDADVRRRRDDVTWFLGAVLVSISIPLATSRAGVLLMALFWCFFGFRVVWGLFRGRVFTGKLSMMNHALMRAVVGFGSMLLCVGLIVLSVWISAPKLVGEFNKSLDQISEARTGGVASIDQYRADSWGDCWRMFRDRPFVGWGLGSHYYLYAVYAKDVYRDAEGRLEHRKEFAHNDWMQYLMELGGPAYLCILGVPLWLFFRYFVGKRVPALGFWSLVGCAFVLLLATFDFPLSNPAVLTLFMVQLTLGLKLCQIDYCREAERASV